MIKRIGILCSICALLIGIGTFTACKKDKKEAGEQVNSSPIVVGGGDDYFKDESTKEDLDSSVQDFPKNDIGIDIGDAEFENSASNVIDAGGGNANWKDGDVWGGD